MNQTGFSVQIGERQVDGALDDGSPCRWNTAAGSPAGSAGGTNLRVVLIVSSWPGSARQTTLAVRYVR